MSSDTSGKPSITGLVLTYNGERLLGKCLESLAFCDAVIVVDSFSSDATESIAREHGATFVQHPWSGALPQFEYALGLVETDWVVSLEQDEICSEPLRNAILAALPGAPADLCGFTPARRSWYYDRFLKHSGWYPDRLLRVFLDHPQRVLTRDQLLNLTQGRDAELFERSIDLLVSRVRQRLNEDARTPAYIKTVRSEGYVFTMPVTIKEANE